MTWRFCNFSWVSTTVKGGRHLCIRRRGHAGGHRCLCDATKAKEMTNMDMEDAGRLLFYGGLHGGKDPQ